MGIGGMKMQTKLTVGMIRFLDQHNGNDLVVTANEFRLTFGLTYEDAGNLIEKWMDIPLI